MEDFGVLSCTLKDGREVEEKSKGSGQKSPGRPLGRGCRSWPLRKGGGVPSEEVLAKARGVMAQIMRGLPLQAADLGLCVGTLGSRGGGGRFEQGRT